VLCPFSKFTRQAKNRLFIQGSLKRLSPKALICHFFNRV
jgi:hypothetical protein